MIHGDGASVAGEEEKDGISYLLFASITMI